MADQIKHGSTEVVGSTGKVSDTGLIDKLGSETTVVDQTVFVETTAPDSSDGENGDVWYQTIS